VRTNIDIYVFLFLKAKTFC